MTEKQYREYFENICRQHKMIKHTDAAPAFIASPSDLPKGNLSRRTAILFPQTLRPHDEKTDNLFKYKTGEIWIIEPCKNDDAKKQLEAQDTSESIGWDIMKRLDKDSKGIIDDRKFVDFDFNTVEGFVLGDQLNNCFGYGYTFVTGDPDLNDYDDPDGEPDEQVWLDSAQ